MREAWHACLVCATAVTGLLKRLRKPSLAKDLILQAM